MAMIRGLRIVDEVVEVVRKRSSDTNEVVRWPTLGKRLASVIICERLGVMVGDETEKFSSVLT